MEKVQMIKVKKILFIPILVFMGLIGLYLIIINLLRFDYWIGDYKYHFYLDSRKAHIVDYRGEGERLSIPTKVGPIPVTYVDMHVFDGNDYIQEVYLGSYQKTVFFDNCKKIDTITFGNNITDFRYSFSECDNIKTVCFPQGLEVISYGFPNCTNLADVYIPESVSDISSIAFIGTQFEKNHLDDKYYVVGNGVLLFCNVNLNEDVVIPSGVKNSCVSLVLEDEHSDRRIYFPETLERINESIYEGDIYFFGGEDFVDIRVYDEGGLIVAPADSPMAKYCEENNINFRPMTEEEEKEWREKTEAAASEITYQDE
jgi:hypothetical protein